MVDKEPIGLSQEEVEKIHPNLSAPERLLVAIFGWSRLDRDYINELLTRTEPLTIEQLADEKIALMIKTVTQEVLSPLNPFEATIVAGHMGLFDGQIRSFTSLGRELRRDRREVGRVFRGALDKLRQELKLSSNFIEP